MVAAYDHTDTARRRQWVCICVCGEQRLASTTALRSGEVTRCVTCTSSRRTVCEDCKVTISYFVRKGSGPSPRWCEECHRVRRNKRQRERRASMSEAERKEKSQRDRKYREKIKTADPMFHRRNNLRRQYGLTLEDFEELLRTQNGRCAICNSESPGKRSKNWHVDHDHATGVVRGILCSHCNIALGNFGDDIERMRKAIEYIERGK